MDASHPLSLESRPALPTVPAPAGVGGDRRSPAPWITLRGWGCRGGLSRAYGI